MRFVIPILQVREDGDLTGVEQFSMSVKVVNGEARSWNSAPACWLRSHAASLSGVCSLVRWSSQNRADSGALGIMKVQG